MRAISFSLCSISFSPLTKGRRSLRSLMSFPMASASNPIASISACLSAISCLLFASSQSLRAAMSVYNASCIASCSFASMASCKNLQCAFSISTHPDSFRIATFFSRTCFCSSAFCFSLSNPDLVSLSWKTAAEYSVFAFWYATAFSCIASSSALFRSYSAAFCRTSPSLTDSRIMLCIAFCFSCSAFFRASTVSCSSCI